MGFGPQDLEISLRKKTKIAEVSLRSQSPKNSIRILASLWFQKNLPRSCGESQQLFGCQDSHEDVKMLEAKKHRQETGRYQNLNTQIKIHCIINSLREILKYQ